MNENEYKLNKALEILALFIYAMLTIATCAAVWNSRPGVSVSIFAILLFLANGYVVYRKVKKLTDEEHED